MSDSPRAPRAPHAPQVGRLGSLVGRFHVTGAFWYRAHLFAARFVPSFVFPPLVWGFTLFFFPFVRTIATALDANLTVAVGPVGFRARHLRAFRTLLNFGWCLTERYERLAGQTRFRMGIVGMDHWRAATGGGRGSILVTAHIGNWEMGSAAPSSEEERHVHLVREEEMSPEAQELIEELLREKMGSRYTTHFAGRDPALGVRLLDALKRGELVALQGDRPRAGGRTCRVKLFDHDFELPVGPLALARSAGVPILPVFVYRNGRLDYRVVFHAPIDVRGDGERATVLQRGADALAGSIETAIREEPLQWFCFRRVWDASGAYDGETSARSMRGKPGI